MQSITIVDITDKLDDQMDRSMRETAIIKGISGSETTWEDPRKKLADTLATLSRQHPPDYYKNNIVRAHRGKGKAKDLVFVKFCNSESLTEAKIIAGKAKQGIFVDQMRSPLVRKRISTALAERKALKQGVGKNWFMYVNDQVKLMVKKAIPSINLFNLFR